MRHTDCPTCGKAVDGLRCGACGWTADGSKAIAPLDRLRWNCADELNGQRCAKLGRFTESVQGTERWYCEDHYAPFRRMRSSSRAAPTPAFRSQVARMRPVADILELEAERIAIEQQDRAL